MGNIISLCRNSNKNSIKKNEELIYEIRKIETEIYNLEKEIDLLIKELGLS